MANFHFAQNTKCVSMELDERLSLLLGFFSETFSDRNFFFNPQSNLKIDVFFSLKKAIVKASLTKTHFNKLFILHAYVEFKIIR